jgi:hypothetical protein
MAHFIDTIVVAFTVALSAAYAAFALGPKSWRAVVARQLGEFAAHLPEHLRLRRAVQRLGTLAAAKAGAACGGCDNCGGETAAKSASDAAAGPNVPDERRNSSEVRIAVAKIGRRS